MTYIGRSRSECVVSPLEQLQQPAKAPECPPIVFWLLEGKILFIGKVLIDSLTVKWILGVEIPEFSFWPSRLFWFFGFFRLFFGRMGCKDVIEHSTSIKIAKIRRHSGEVRITWLWSTVCSAKMTTETIVLYEKVFTPLFIPVIVECWPVIVIEFWILERLHSIFLPSVKTWWSANSVDLTVDPKYAILSYVTENGWIWNGFTITDTGPIVIVSNVHTVNLVNETTTR